MDEAVVRVAGRGHGPTIAAALVAAAFLIGLVRPWDWLTGGPVPTLAPPPGAAITEEGDATLSPSARATGGLAPIVGAPTCGYPTSWRTSTIQLWAGRRARVWTAAEAVPASGVLDPSIPLNLVASDVVEAIGWCAPVEGPDRPPLTAEATLFRLVDGTATEVPVDRLEPVARDALGELWLPQEQAGGRRPPWTPGRYVIRLAVKSGAYVRYLGLEVGLPQPRPEASAVPEPSVTGMPGPPSATVPDPSP